MTRISRIASLFAVVVALCVAGAAFAQASSQMTSRTGTVIAKYDGKVVVKFEDGTTQEFTPPPGKTIMVSGVLTNYDTLKVGTVLTQEFIKTTKTVPVKTIEIKNATVVKVVGGTLLVQNADGYKSYQIPADFKFLVNGEEMSLQDLGPGMKLTATIVSKSTKTVSETEAKGVSGVAPAAPPPAPKAAAAPPPPPPTAVPAPPPPRSGAGPGQEEAPEDGRPASARGARRRALAPRGPRPPLVPPLALNIAPVDFTGGLVSEAALFHDGPAPDGARRKNGEKMKPRIAAFAAVAALVALAAVPAAAQSRRRASRRSRR